VPLTLRGRNVFALDVEILPGRPISRQLWIRRLRGTNTCSHFVADETVNPPAILAPLRDGTAPVDRNVVNRSTAGWSNRQLARFWPWNSRFESLPRSLAGGCCPRVLAVRAPRIRWAQIDVGLHRATAWLPTLAVRAVRTRSDRSRGRRARTPADRDRVPTRSGDARARDRRIGRSTGQPERGLPRCTRW
jgi:hypothetical protein